MQFHDTMKVVRCWVYFTGEKPCLKPQDPRNLTKMELNAAEKWEYKDSVASYLLCLHLSNPIAMHLNSCFITQESWEKIIQEFQAKSTYAQANLHQLFLEMHCVERKDV